jgi:hypothetical protein
MARQITDLFLLEDLKAVGRKSELAESDLEGLAGAGGSCTGHQVRGHG